MERIVVSLAKVQNLARDLRRCLNYLPKVKEKIRESKNILLKPNLILARSPSYGITTDPGFVREVAIFIREINRSAKIILGESSGTNNCNITQVAFRVCGMEEAVADLDVEIRNFDHDEIIVKENPNARLVKKISIARTVLEADFIINLPKLKTHRLTYITGAVKNMMGCLPLDNKSKFHKIAVSPETFAKFLLDLVEYIPPDLTIIDAIEIMEGNGPLLGNVIKGDMIMAGFNPVALDIIASQCMGYDHLKVCTNSLALKEKPEYYSLSNIEVVGDSIFGLRKKCKKPSIIRPHHKYLKKILGIFAKYYPRINKNLCTKCGNCLRNCPVSLFEINDYLKVRHDIDCTMCFCCEELCPQTAIRVEYKLRTIREILDRIKNACKKRGFK